MLDLISNMLLIIGNNSAINILISQQPNLTIRIVHSIIHIKLDSESIDMYILRERL